MKDLIIEKDLRYRNTFHKTLAKPNSKQAAVAQYAVASMAKYPHQIWSIPTGEGKSFITATIALMMLGTESVHKVHLIFDSEVLLKRD